MSPLRTRVQSILLRLRATGAAKASGKSKKSKGEGASAPPVSKEIRESVVLGANIYKSGSDPSVKQDSEYPDWLWTLLDKQPSLSELKRKSMRDMSLEELSRLCKLENRENIKTKNSERAKA